MRYRQIGPRTRKFRRARAAFHECHSPLLRPPWRRHPVPPPVPQERPRQARRYRREPRRDVLQKHEGQTPGARDAEDFPLGGGGGPAGHRGAYRQAGDGTGAHQLLIRLLLRHPIQPRLPRPPPRDWRSASTRRTPSSPLVDFNLYQVFIPVNNTSMVNRSFILFLKYMMELLKILCCIHHRNNNSDEDIGSIRNKGLFSKTHHYKYGKSVSYSTFIRNGYTI